MRIMINALSARRGGGQTYLQHLLDKFPDTDHPEIIIAAPSSLKIPENRPNIKKLPVKFKFIERPLFRMAWERLFFPKILSDYKIDVLFCPGGSVSGKVPDGCKVVTTFQNMMPFDHTQRKRYPFGYRRLRNWLLEKNLLSSMIRSDLVIFISHYARDVIENRSNGKIKKSITVHHGVDDHFKKNTQTQLEPPQWAPKEGYLLYVSIFDIYKSQLEIVREYAMLKSRRQDLMKLVLVGPDYENTYGQKVQEEIKSYGLEDDIIVKNGIPYTDLPAVYQNAYINIFASMTENCPFILLEMLAAGRPMLVTDKNPMTEICGDSVEYFCPTNKGQLADKLETIIDNNEALERLSQNALTCSHQYNWENTAEKTWNSITYL
jgi:glycosyltransferase involved in cell wall biosynthesis